VTAAGRAQTVGRRSESSLGACADATFWMDRRDEMLGWLGWGHAGHAGGRRREGAVRGSRDVNSPASAPLQEPALPYTSGASLAHATATLLLLLSSGAAEWAGFAWARARTTRMQCGCSSVACAISRAPWGSSASGRADCRLKRACRQAEEEEESKPAWDLEESTPRSSGAGGREINVKQLTPPRASHLPVVCCTPGAIP
jgi:hypothetical protein